MNAHIITIGDEILIGQTINTNAAFIGEKLSGIQINVRKTSTVPDDEEEILREFKTCLNENDLVIVTGGLGPTHDDITRTCIVKFFHTELVRNDEVLDDVRNFFNKRARKITKINEDQALVPKEANVIRNKIGTAPGVWIEKEDKIFIVMPGVPFEMQAMMNNSIIPKLQEKIKNKDFFVKRSNLLTTGIPESTLFERLGNIDELLNGAKLAFLPSQFGVKLRVTVNEKSEELANNKISEIEQKIRGKVGRFIYSKQDEPLENVIARMLLERGITIAVAESCTGGLISNLLTNISGSSKYYERGVISYSNASKVEILKVSEDTISQNGAVSLEVARQMAEGIKSISGTDLGLAITGIMGPTGGSSEKPVGLAYVGLCDDKVCTAKKFQFGDDRSLNKQRAAQAALEMIRRYLLGIPLDE
ncbi:MAG: competence/damage-inducible protein A [Ignavibacteriaceae bacterium]|nr:competence/damage-inducible protein A [Ignavibacteriaceae bacterium]